MLETQPELKPSSSQPHLTGADGLRAIACLMVVFSHLWQRLARDDQAPAVQFIQDFFVKGAYGVSVFFVLSGFLLSYPFWARYLEGKPFPDLRQYTRRRALRIVPGFYASLIVSFIVTMILVKDVQYPWLRLISALTFTNAFHYVTFFPTDLNGPLWSIGFEVVCYVLMPLCMIGLFRLAGNRSSRLGLEARGWAYWIGVMLLVLMVNQLIVTFLVPDGVNRGWQYGIIGGAKIWMPGYNPVGLFAHYALGILAALFVAGRRARGIHARTVEAGAGETPGSSFAFDAVALLAFLIAAGILFALRFTQSGPTEPEQNGIQMQPYLYPIFPGLVAVMLASLPFSKLLGRVFDNPFARYTATVSFGLYIWHYLLLEVVRLTILPDWKYFGIRDLSAHLAISAACLAAAYALATLSYRLIESPFLKNKARAETKPGVSGLASQISRP